MKRIFNSWILAPFLVSCSGLSFTASGPNGEPYKLEVEGITESPAQVEVEPEAIVPIEQQSAQPEAIARPEGPQMIGICDSRKKDCPVVEVYSLKGRSLMVRHEVNSFLYTELSQEDQWFNVWWEDDGVGKVGWINGYQLKYATP